MVENKRPIYRSGCCWGLPGACGTGRQQESHVRRQRQRLAQHWPNTWQKTSCQLHPALVVVPLLPGVLPPVLPPVQPLPH